MTYSQSETTTLPGKLAAEISRVTQLREQYCEAGRLVGDMRGVAPAITLITLSLDAAIKASNSPDIAEQIAALRDLGEWQE